MSGLAFSADTDHGIVLSVIAMVDTPEGEDGSCSESLIVKFEKTSGDKALAWLSLKGNDGPNAIQANALSALTTGTDVSWSVNSSKKKKCLGTYMSKLSWLNIKK